MKQPDTLQLHVMAPVLPIIAVTAIIIARHIPIHAGIALDIPHVAPNISFVALVISVHTVSPGTPHQQQHGNNKQARIASIHGCVSTPGSVVGILKVKNT
jgi:hypothetical protein